MNSKKRIGIAHLWQEQNTFSPILTNFEDFEDIGITFKDEILEKFKNVKEMGGFIKACNEEDIEIVPLISLWDWPKGPIVDKDYLKIKEMLLSLIEDSLPLDGILISFHGAMVAQSTDDVEGDILNLIHERVGVDLPIALSLDLHANITKKMINNSIYIEGYHTCPHTDLYETGYKSAKIFLKYLAGKIKNIHYGFTKIPMITPARLHNTKKDGPFKVLFDELKRIEQKDDVIGASLFTTQPWLDVRELGWSVLVYSSNKNSIAKDYSDKIASKAWQNRKKFFIKETIPKDALRKASLMDKGLMVISDSDSTLSGGTGDNTCILKALIEENFQKKALLTIVDKEVVHKAIIAGKGNIISCLIGGKLDKRYSSPIPIEGKVLKLLDGKFTIKSGHIGRTEVDMGRIVVLEVQKIHILVSENMGPVYEQTVYKNAGLDPLDYRVVVVKSPVGFRDAYEPIADNIILADCPGITSSNLNLFKFANIDRPLFPFDDIDNF